MNAHKLGSYLIGQDCCHACDDCRKKPIYIYKWSDCGIQIDFVCKKGVDFITETHVVKRGKKLVELDDKIMAGLLFMFKKYNWDKDDQGDRQKEVWEFVENWGK